MATLQPLSLEEQQAHDGATHVIFVRASDLTETAVNTDQVFSVLDIEPNVSVRCIYMHLLEAFEDVSDATFNSTTLKAGVTSADESQLTETELNTHASPLMSKEGADLRIIYQTNTELIVTVSAATGKALAELDRGEVAIYFAMIDAR